MTIREATNNDISQIQVVRNSVKENALSNPALVTDDDCAEYINVRGKGWVCEVDGTIVGFAIADLQDNNIWALFLHPDMQGRGIGRRLHDTMLDWHFSQTMKDIWLSTAPNTRAETFYRKSGWRETGTYGKGEVKFEMTPDDWKKYKSAKIHSGAV